MSVGEEEEILGDILLHRFIKNWSAIRTMNYINERYNTYMDDRQYRRLQDQALWEGALMCPVFVRNLPAFDRFRLKNSRIMVLFKKLIELTITKYM